MTSSLVGSEMCIRDRRHGVVWGGMVWYGVVRCGMGWYGVVWCGMVWYGAVSYTHLTLPTICSV
eukprot:1914383-Prorocentrum_lima.AAC.1